MLFHNSKFIVYNVSIICIWTNGLQLYNSLFKHLNYGYFLNDISMFFCNFLNYCCKMLMMTGVNESQIFLLKPDIFHNIAFHFYMQNSLKRTGK